MKPDDRVDDDETKDGVRMGDHSNQATISRPSNSKEEEPRPGSSAG